MHTALKNIFVPLEQIVQDEGCKAEKIGENTEIGCSLDVLELTFPKCEGEDYNRVRLIADKITDVGEGNVHACAIFNSSYRLAKIQIYVCDRNAESFAEKIEKYAQDLKPLPPELKQTKTLAAV